ncbi:iron-containing alcohol dehydrogenase [Maricurvus nonylphenolicus]|uniref:iron-containing alcohol dehydrogenase n=1 Tax=Maricurvus nonylphenolicus TaxID=1008307 RepID=UPI0036F2ADCC
MYQGEYGFLSQSNVVFGQSAASAIATEITKRQVQRVLLVSSRSLNRRLGATASISASLGERQVGLFDDIEPHAPLSAILNLVNCIDETRPDLIVSVGGGSVIDTIKVATLSHAAGAKTTQDIAALRVTVDEKGKQVSPVNPHQLIRQIAVPTTLSGAEWGTIGGAVDTERNIKDIYAHSQMCSDTIIYDPELCRLTPNELWISTAIRAVDHAVETILSPAANPFTDGSALHALRLFGRSLSHGDQQELSLESIQESQFAVWLATVGLMRTPYGASHGIGHQLGAVAGVPHGLCSCILLPAVLAYNAEAAGERDAWIAEALGFPEKSASEACLELIRRLKLTDNLKDAGVTREQLPQIARASLGAYFVKNNLRPITSESQVLEILAMAWSR